MINQSKFNLSNIYDDCAIYLLHTHASVTILSNRELGTANDTEGDVVGAGACANSDKHGWLPAGAGHSQQRGRPGD